MRNERVPDRNIAMELVRVTEAVAVATARWMGRGDKIGADGAAFGEGLIEGASAEVGSCGATPAVAAPIVPKTAPTSASAPSRNC